MTRKGGFGNFETMILPPECQAGSFWGAQGHNTASVGLLGASLEDFEKTQGHFSTRVCFQVARLGKYLETEGRTLARLWRIWGTQGQNIARVCLRDARRADFGKLNSIILSKHASDMQGSGTSGRLKSRNGIVM